MLSITGSSAGCAHGWLMLLMLLLMLLLQTVAASPAVWQQGP
jgi:uncharacterized membrane protein